MKKFYLALLPFLFAAVLAILSVGSVQAGCCLVVSVDELPQAIVAGEPLTIHYTARLVTGHNPVPYTYEETITAVHVETNEQLAIEPEPVEGERGRYEVTFVFPTSGLWQWELGGRPMPPLMVQAAPVVEPGPGEIQGPFTGLATVLGVVGLLATAAGLWLVLRSRTPVRLAFLILAVVMAVGGFAFKVGPGIVSAERETTPSAIAPARMGEALFVAKGCISCHRHENLSIDTWMVDFGPELTHYRGNPDFLRRWLNDPRAVRPGTFMPNLGLSEAEIETLVTFLSDGP